VAASGAIPIIFSPVRLGDIVLVDGGLSNNLPADVAREMGGDVVLGVNVISEFHQDRKYASFFDIALATMDLAIRSSTETGVRQCDLCVHPEAHSFSDLKRAPAMMAAGEEAMRRALPRLRALLELEDPIPGSVPVP